MTPGLFLLAFAVALVAWHSLMPVRSVKAASAPENGDAKDIDTRQ